MKNLGSVLKMRGITLSAKVHVVKAMFFPAVTYRCESEVAQLCLTLCDPMDCSPPVSSIRGILQARILEWVAIFSRDLPDPGMELWSPSLQADSLPSEPPGNPDKQELVPNLVPNCE